MKNLFESLRPKIYLPRPAEVTAVKAPLTDKPFLPKNVDITVFYGGHDSRNDFEALKPHFIGIDIFIPEMTAWTIEEVELLSRISQGDKSARKQLEIKHFRGKFDAFTDAETKTLLGSGVYVTPIDYSAEHDRADEIATHFDNWGLLDKVVPNWNKTLDNIVAYARTEADLEEHREKIMARSIGPRLETMIATDPELNRKERVRVLIQQGAAHREFFYPKLAAMASNAESTTATQVLDEEKGLTPDHLDQLAFAFRAHTQIPPEKRHELAMRALARIGLRFNLIPLIIRESDYHNRILVPPPAEEMVERFSVEDIKKFHQQLVTANEKKKN